MRLYAFHVRTAHLHIHVRKHMAFHARTAHAHDKEKVEKMRFEKE